MGATFNRIASGLVAAAATGAIYAAIVVSLAAWNDRMSVGEIAANGAQSAIAGAVFGAVAGALPAIAIIYLTRARYAPWRGAPVLVAGAAIGMLIVTAALELIGKDLSKQIAEAGMLLLMIAAAAGALIASRFLPSGKES